MKTESVLLINPPREIPQKADFPPMGLAYIAGPLRREGVKVSLLDASAFSWKLLGRAIKEKNPDIVGIPCWTVERRQSFNTAKLVKGMNPHAKIIFGGHHATAFPEYMFKQGHADAVVLGEGEGTTSELVEAFLRKSELSEIKGIVYQINSEVFINEHKEFIKDLDDIPFPDYEDFNLSNYLGLPEIKGNAAAIITSRGCPYKCTFCSASKFWDRKWRYRSAVNVLDEIEWLFRKHSVKAFMFFDDNFSVRKERAIEICEGILERGMNITWVACSHVNQVDKELLSWMKRAGCYRIDYGIESGSPEILRNIRKGQTVEQIEEAFRLTHQAGIMPRAYLMVGNPGENEKTIQQTVELIEKIKPYGSTSGQILWLLPDTEVYELARSQGIVSDEFWLENDSMVYYTGENSERELKALRSQLMRGVARNEGGFKSYGGYFVREVYYKYPILQKLRKWRRTLGF